MNESRLLSDRLSPLPPGRHLLPPDFVAANQRERILLAVTELVAERGYRKTTLEAIAKTARVAPGTLYEHFADKEACFVAAFDEIVASARETLAEEVDQDRAWPDRVAAALDVFLEMVVANPAPARLCLVEAQAAGGAALARYQEMLEDVASMLREGRERCSREARLPDGLETAIAGGLAWLVHQRLAADRTDDLKALLPEMLQVALTPYLGEAAASAARLAA
jgi:AcrR family transcriptional regulator